MNKTMIRGNITTEEVSMFLCSQIIEFESIPKQSPEPESVFKALIDKVNHINKQL